MHCTHSSTRSRKSEKVKGKWAKDNKQVIYKTQPWTVNSKHLKTTNSLEWNCQLKSQWSIYSTTSRKNIKNLILPNVIEPTEQQHSSHLRGEHKCSHYRMHTDRFYSPEAMHFSGLTYSTPVHTGILLYCRILTHSAQGNSYGNIHDCRWLLGFNICIASYLDHLLCSCH